MNRVAGLRGLRETLTVDYADVLAQAVANERERVLREVRDLLERVAISNGDHYSSPSRNAKDFRDEVLKNLKGIV